MRLSTQQQTISSTSVGTPEIPASEYVGREVSKATAKGSLDGEVIGVSEKGYRFTVEWYDGTEEKFSKPNLEPLLKPLSRSSPLYKQPSGEYEYSPPRIGPEYQAAIPVLSKRTASESSAAPPSKTTALALQPAKKLELDRQIAALREEIKAHSFQTMTLTTRKEELEKENQKLTTTVDALRGRVAHLEVFEQQAVRLREQLEAQVKANEQIDRQLAEARSGLETGTDRLRTGVKKLFLR